MDDDEIWKSCSADTICAARDSGNPLTVKVDTSYAYYLDNWYT